MALSSPTATWLDELRAYYLNDPNGRKLIEQLEKTSPSLPHHTHHNDLVYVQGRLFIPNIPHLRVLILQEFHNSTLGGHAGVQATLRRLLPSFFWPTLKNDVIDFIKQCPTCQAIKYPTYKPYGLLQPLPIPSHPCHDITMDFITHLPPSNGKTAIWVIVDRLSKFAHFISLPTHYTAHTLASIFLKDIYRLHGLPNSIISDRDPLFLSHFWTQLFKQLGTKLRHSSSYHPQTDGQSEVVNRCLESYLHAFVHDEPRSWNRYLYLAEFWYNTSYHSSTNMTPFKAMYGREATTIHDYTLGSNPTASIDASLVEHQRIITVLKIALDKTRQRMTKQANKKRMEKQFQVGDLVYLRLRNYRQTSVAARANQKLSKRYFGPYRILEKVGPVAYRLQLPIASRAHPVFHVSLLKESHSQSVSTEFPSEWLLDHPTSEPEPERILQQRNSGINTEVLIQWKNQELSDATWENLQEMTTRFPSFVGHEDESAVEREEIDTGHSATQAQPHAAQQAPRPKRFVKKPNRYLD